MGEDYKCVVIPTIYPAIQDGLVSLARSLGIQPSVCVRDEFISGGVHHKKCFIIRLSPCSALSNVLSLCSIKRKRVNTPLSVERLPHKWYFNVKKLMEAPLNEPEEMNVPNVVRTWGNQKIIWHIKKLNISANQMVAHFKESFSQSTLYDFLRGKVNESSVRQYCEALLIERWDQVKKNSALYQEGTNTVLGEYFGFQLKKTTLASDHLFLLSNSVVAHNCIIFMDEIDAIGGRRFTEGTSADREIQRTLMELLNQLDGFDALGQVKMITATNRPDVLDPALMRPGRLDRKIEIPLPNEMGRLQIIKIHSSKMNMGGEIDYDAIVKLTDGMNGADLRNVCTEAGMFAIRANRDTIIQEDFLKAARKVSDMKKLENPSHEYSKNI